MQQMAFVQNQQFTLAGQSNDVAGAEAIPVFGQSIGRDLLGRILPPFFALASVIAHWWLHSLIFPRLLPNIGDLNALWTN